MSDLALSQKINKLITDIINGWGLPKEITSYIETGDSQSILNMTEYKADVINTLKTNGLAVNTPTKDELSLQEISSDKNEAGNVLASKIAPFVLKRRSAFAFAVISLKQKIKELETGLADSTNMCSQNDQKSKELEAKVKDLINIINAMLQYHSEDTELKIVNAV